MSLLVVVVSAGIAISVQVIGVIGATLETSRGLCDCLLCLVDIVVAVVLVLVVLGVIVGVGVDAVVTSCY